MWTWDGMFLPNLGKTFPVIISRTETVLLQEGNNKENSNRIKIKICGHADETWTREQIKEHKHHVREVDEKCRYLYTGQNKHPNTSSKTCLKACNLFKMHRMDYTYHSKPQDLDWVALGHESQTPTENLLERKRQISETEMKPAWPEYKMTTTLKIKPFLQQTKKPIQSRHIKDAKWKPMGLKKKAKIHQAFCSTAHFFNKHKIQHCHEQGDSSNAVSWSLFINTEKKNHSVCRNRWSCCLWVFSLLRNLS